MNDGIAIKISRVLFLIILLLFILTYFFRSDLALDWSLKSTAHDHEMVVDTFEIGSIGFDLSASVYLLEENYVGSPVFLSKKLLLVMLLIGFVGISFLLAIFSFFKKTPFIVSQVALIFFIVSTNIHGLFEGSVLASKLVASVLIIIFVGLGYFFHSINSKPSLFIRFICFGVLIGLVGIIVNIYSQSVIFFIIANIQYGFVAIAIVFLFIIAEELAYCILHFTTSSRGKNSIHFFILSLLTLGLISLSFFKKTGVYSNLPQIIDPFVLLACSAGVALWSLPKKQEYFNIILSKDIDARLLMVALGIPSLIFLMLGFVTANDSSYESYHYLIIYFHMAFSGSFLIYVIINFIDPLLKGFPVQPIVFQERNFPYVTSKLVGMVAVVAFFLMTNKEPWLLFRSADYNYKSNLEKGKGQKTTRNYLLKESEIYGHNNHFANYELGGFYESEGDFDKSSHDYIKSTKRYPTEQSFVNAARSTKRSDEEKALKILLEGEFKFPSSGPINNNLLNILINKGAYQIASKKRNLELNYPSCCIVGNINYWRLQFLTKNNNVDWGNSYSKATSSEKVNIIPSIIYHGIKQPGSNIEEGGSAFQKSLLINNLAYVKDIAIHDSMFHESISTIAYPGTQSSIRMAHIYNSYKNGEISNAITFINNYETQLSIPKKAQFYLLKGLIYLDNMQYENSLRAFEKSIEFGNHESKKAKLICQLELGLITIEKLDLFRGLDNMKELDIYFNWDKYGETRLNYYLEDQGITDNVKRKLWDKVSRRYTKKWDTAGFQRYYKIFMPYLDSIEIAKATFDLKIMTGSTMVSSDKPPNPFDETVVINYIQNIEQNDLIDAYNVSYEFYMMNQKSINFLKKLAILAMKNGLKDDSYQYAAEIEEIDSDSYDNTLAELREISYRINLFQ